jgi:hypothetical protein
VPVLRQQLSFDPIFQWEIPRTPDQRNVVVGTGLEFPEPDLLDHLVDNYFRDNNAIFPLLNEILFKGQLADGLHLVDQGFSAIVLLVAALGTRGSEDPRIFVDPSQPHSRGWKWFNQVQRLQRPLVAPATLYDIQIIMVRVTDSWMGHLAYLCSVNCCIPPWLLSTLIWLVFSGYWYSVSNGCRSTPSAKLWEQTDCTQ